MKMMVVISGVPTRSTHKFLCSSQRTKFHTDLVDLKCNYSVFKVFMECGFIFLLLLLLTCHRFTIRLNVYAKRNVDRTILIFALADRKML